jgi:hypothetical protein
MTNSYGACSPSGDGKGGFMSPIPKRPVVLVGSLPFKSGGVKVQLLFRVVGVDASVPDADEL